MVDSQSHSSSHQARVLGVGGEEEKETGAPELVSTCWGYPEANSDPESNISTPKKLPSRGFVSCLQWRRRPPSDISIAPVNFASLSPPSSLANSCTFLVGIWRIIRDLARFALVTVPGRKRRILFLVWLKNKRIFSHRFLCLSCNAHDLGGIFLFKKVKKLGTHAGFQG